MMPQIKNVEVISCPNCKCTYFEQITVHQFPQLQTVVIGQATPPVGDIGFYAFRCFKCHEAFEPNVQINTFDSTRKKYDAFMDEMEDDDNNGQE